MRAGKPWLPVCGNRAYDDADAFLRNESRLDTYNFSRIQTVLPKLTGEAGKQVSSSRAIPSRARPQPHAWAVNFSFVRRTAVLVRCTWLAG
jgi:hypothetical protein